MDDKDTLDFLVARLEKFFYGAAVLCLLVLVGIQTLVFFVPGAGGQLNLALQKEGKPLQEEALFYEVGAISTAPWNSITLELLDYQSRPDVKIEVNGIETGTFLKKEYTLSVREGDVLTVFNPDERHPVRVRVSKKTPNIIKPSLGAEIGGIGRSYFDPVGFK